MTHVSQFSFDADGVDISRYVERWDWRHGNAVFTNDRGNQFFNPSGTMILENGDGYWTEDRLENITLITAINDTVTVGEMGIKKWDRYPDERRVQLRLESKIADSYDAPTNHMAISDILEADVLSRAGVSITNRTAWAGYTARQSTEYCNGLYDWLQAFSIYADVLLAETATGGFVAVVPATEARHPSISILDSTHWILAAQRRFVRQRGWRRNSQTVKFRTRTRFELGHRDFGTHNQWRRVNSQIANVEAILEGSTALRIEFDLEGVFDSNDFPSDQEDLICTAIFWSSGNPGTPTFRDDGRQSTSEYVWDGILFEAPNTDERCAIRLRKANNGTISTSDRDGLQMYGLSRIDTAYTRTLIFSESETTYNVATSEERQPLTEMPWAIADADAAKITTKLNRYWSFIPEATRVAFATDQASQAQWNEILNLGIGDTVNLQLVTDGMAVQNQSWAMYKRWRYLARGFSNVEVQFLSHGELVTRQVFLGDEDHPIYLGDEDHPVEIAS